MIGPGKYDKLCRLVRKRADARGVMVVVVGGNAGHGFSIEMHQEDLKNVPEMLRSIANQVENDVKQIVGKTI